MICKKSLVLDKSYAFSIRIVNAYKFLVSNSEYVLSKQLLRSGTAIGALCAESKNAQSKADFLNIINIALKEANETEYWLRLLKDTTYLDQNQFVSLYSDCDELVKMLTSIVKTTKKSIEK